MIKEGLRLSLQSCIPWDRNNWDCRKHSQPTSKFSQLLGFLLFLCVFLLSEKATIWRKCILTLCNAMSMVSLAVSVWLQILPNTWTIWSLRSFLTVLNYFWYLVKLLTIKCFQDRSSLIIYSITHMDFYLFCWVLIYNTVRKSIFLCCAPDAVSNISTKVVLSLFSSILLAIFLLIPAVHCQYYTQCISYFQKWLSLWCESSEHKPYVAGFDCNSAYTWLRAFSVRNTKHAALLRNGADLTEALGSVLPKAGSFLSSVHLNHDSVQR